MANVLNGLKVARKLAASNPQWLSVAARGMAGGWNKDFKPALYPSTEKERIEAAKKYKLLPQEYQPYADDGLGYGDYPKLDPGLGVEAKDPYYPYDFPEHKRNFEEVLHAEIDLYGEDRYSQPEKPRLSNQQYWFSFLGVMAGCAALYYWLEDKKMFRPVAAKQYPAEGVVHYTFELEDQDPKKKKK